MTGNSGDGGCANQGKLQAFRDIFTAFALLSLCRVLPLLETKEQCVFHIMSSCCMVFFAFQVRSSQILASVLVLLVVCLQSRDLLAHSDYQDRVLIELLLGQVLLLSVGLMPSGLVLWTTAALLLCFWPVDKAFPRVVELISLLTVPICSKLLQGSSAEPHARLEISEAKVHHCLKLVLQQLRVPLQLALHEGEDAGQRLRQVWQLLTGLDQQLEAQFTSSVLQSTWKQTSAEKADLSCLAKAAAWWQPCESKGSKVLPESLPGSPRSPCSQRKEPRETGLLEVSTSSGSTQWEVLPDGVRMELEIDLERESMPVTEVKFYLSQEERDAFHLKSLFAKEDYENFRNWLEPEVNRSMHGTAIGESTSCALRLPIGGRVNGILAVDGGLNGLRLRCSMTQMSVDKS